MPVRVSITNTGNPESPVKAELESIQSKENVTVEILGGQNTTKWQITLKTPRGETIFNAFPEDGECEPGPLRARIEGML